MKFKDRKIIWCSTFVWHIPLNWRVKEIEIGLTSKVSPIRSRGQTTWLLDLA